MLRADLDTPADDREIGLGVTALATLGVVTTGSQRLVVHRDVDGAHVDSDECWCGVVVLEVAT